MKTVKVFIFLVIIFFLSFCSYLQEDTNQNRLTTDFILDWEYVSGPQISPDGSTIAYRRTLTDKINDTYKGHIWIINYDGSGHRHLTEGSSPRWSPDGKRLAYICTVEGKRQIFVRWMDSGETTQITHLDRSPINISWSPDGEKIAFAMLVPAPPAPLIQMPAKPKEAKWVAPPIVEERLVYRYDGYGYRPQGFYHIFIVPSSGGTARQVTKGDYDHKPVTPFHYGDETYTWSPDSETIYFGATLKPDADYISDYLTGGAEIYALNIRNGKVRPLTDRNGPDQNPKASPDGRFIAYTGWDQKNYTYTVSNLYLMDIDGENKRLISDAFDRSIYSVVWAPDSSGLYFTAEDRGSSNLYFANINGGIKQVTKGAHVLHSFSLSSNKKVAAILSRSQEPNDVVTFSLPNPTIKKITHVNNDLLQGVELGAVEEIWYKSFDGKDIHGWIVKPPDFDPEKKYPLVLYIHGGPHMMYSVGFRFGFQHLAAHGYVVLYTNPRGSTGYGEEFGNAVLYNYPKDDYHDLMAGVDAVIKKGYINEDNLFVCGGSGGGLLTGWIIGHTNRFRAAVMMMPVTNQYSFVGTVDGPYWFRRFRKMPWEDANEYMAHSPISYVGNVNTPVMLIGCELDLRTPMEQTEQYYRALKIQKKKVVMVRVHEEYHGAGGIHPTNWIAQMLYLKYWFDTHKTE